MIRAIRGYAAWAWMWLCIAWRRWVLRQWSPATGLRPGMRLVIGNQQRIITRIAHPDPPSVEVNEPFRARPRRTRGRR